MVADGYINLTIDSKTTKFAPTLDFIWKNADTIKALFLTMPLQHIDYVRKNRTTRLSANRDGYLGHAHAMKMEMHSPLLKLIH